MIHLADVSWAQLILIEAGVVFQLVAVGAFLMDRSTQRGLKRATEEGMDMDRREVQFHRRDHAGPAQVQAQPPGMDKSKFTQSFKFRSGHLQRR